MNRLQIILALLIFCSLPTLADDSLVPHIQNPANPTGGVEKMKLTELWRAGGLDEDVIFGEIIDVVSDRSGNLYFLDHQLCQVMVFSEDGEHLRNLSREGEGPGDIQQPVDLLLMPEESLGIAMGFPGKIVRITYNDTSMTTLYPVGDPSDGGFGVLRGAKYEKGLLVACGGSVAFNQDGSGTNKRNLSISDLSCQEPITFLEKSTPMLLAERKYVETDEYYVIGRWDLSAEGRIYAAANRDRYEISVFDGKGQLTEIIERDYQPRRRSEEEKDAVGSDMRVVINGEEIQYERQVEDYDECVTRLFVGGDGTLWVLTPHGLNDLPEDTLEVWDLFDKDGKYIKQISIPLSAGLSSGRTFFLDQGKLVIISGTGAEDDSDESSEVEPMEIICYQIG